MSWLPWAISGVGAVFLVTAVVGVFSQPDGPAEAARDHRVHRVVLPLALGWLFFVGWFPRALGAPWLVADICILIGLMPGVLIFVAARGRTR